MKLSLFTASPCVQAHRVFDIYVGINWCLDVQIHRVRKIFIVE